MQKSKQSSIVLIRQRLVGPSKITESNKSVKQRKFKNPIWKEKKPPVVRSEA